MLEAHVNEKLVFSKFFTEQSLFLKKYVFGDHFHLIRVEGRPNHPEKNIHIQTIMDTCGQGLICRQGRYVTPLDKFELPKLQ